jgi:hypothetical protein
MILRRKRLRPGIGHLCGNWWFSGQKGNDFVVFRRSVSTPWQAHYTLDTLPAAVANKAKTAWRNHLIQ